MKYFIAFIFILTLRLSVSAQTNDTIRQGIAFYNEGKYNAAIIRFTEALKAEPENAYANYQMALSLFAAKRAKEALPYVDKAIKSTNPSVTVAAYCLQASIFDLDGDHKKAIGVYNTAIKINPDHPQIYYNLAVAQFGDKQYPEAELSAIQAIKKNPKHSGSLRLYGLVTFHQNKRANALLGLCSFLLLEPTGARAAEAYGNIQHIIQGGTLADDIGVKPAKRSEETNALNIGISKAVLSGKSKKLTGIALLEYQLKATFTLAGEVSEKKTEKWFYDSFFAAYFYKLSQSENMPAFTRTITLTDKTMGSSTWTTNHPAEMNTFNDWLKTTERNF